MKDQNEDNKRSGINNYIKYSGLFFQMIFVIGIFAFAGYKIDEYRNDHRSIFTAGLSLIGVIIAIYQVLNGLNNPKNRR